LNVLFVCVGNQGRSVMAERLFRQAVGERHSARSAGSVPGSATHPQVLDALEELGLDASDHVPAKLDDERIGWADVIVATCDDACPVVPGKRYVSWQIEDPAGQSLADVRRIRDEIAGRVHELVADLG
jgi:arsenate reductase (thioredoxin)